MKRQERILLIVMAIGLSLLLIVRDVFEIELSKYIYFAYIAAFFALAEYKTMVYMLCFCLPLVCGLPGTYIMPVALLLLFVKKKRIDLWQIAVLIFLAILEVLSHLCSLILNVPGMVQYISYVGVLLFLIHDNAELDCLFCVKMYMFGVSLLCGIILTTALITAPDDWLEMFAKGFFRFGGTQMEELQGMKMTLNTNSLAYYSITGMCCGIVLMEQRGDKAKPLYICLTILVIALGLLTVSRSWLLVGAFCLILYIGSKIKHPKRFWGTMLMLTIVVLSIVWIFGAGDEVIKAFEARFSQEALERDNHRDTIFVDFMNVFWSDFRVIFLGASVASYHEVLNHTGSMHNGTQQILVCLGVVGAGVFITALVRPILEIKNQGKRAMVYWLPLIGVVIFVQTIQFLNPTMLMLPYIIGVYALKAGGVINEDLHHNSGHRRRKSVELEARK